MKKNNLFIFIIVGLFFLLADVYSQKTVSIESLLKELVDRNELANYPDPYYSCGQFSSYDRAAVAKDEPGWFGNNDWSMFLRTETGHGRKEFVMADMEGPGCIVRWWMTFGGKEPAQGTMRIYIDDMINPVIEANPFELLSGNALTEAPLAASVAETTPHHMRGHNLYFPIPYAKRCKITYESKNLFEDRPGSNAPDAETVYYNINYRTYEQGTKVVSFSPSEMKKNKSLIADIQKRLKEKIRGTDKMKLEKTDLSATLQPGQRKEISITGSRAIQQLTMKLKAENQEQALRSTVLEIRFDNEKTVYTPIGDFYGIGYKPIYSSTWYTETRTNGVMNAYWVMPFRESCTISLINRGNRPVEISDAFAAYANRKWDRHSMYFGVTWQQYTGVTAYAPDYCRDLGFASLQGKGVYVGDAVTIFNTTHGWWGEGDEKIYIDGEEFPSHFGTGTEDYYGYAWCSAEIFNDHPFIAQPIGEGSFDPAVSVNLRYRALDKIPFRRSLQFDMELYQHWVRARFNYAPISYWYILPGGKSLVKEDTETVTYPVALKREDIYSPELQLTIEGESLLPVKIEKGKIDYQMFFRELWSDAMQLFWYEALPASKAEFEFECAFPGSYDFTGVFTMAENYGVFNVYLNGELLISKLDLQHKKVTLREVNVPATVLKKGKNRLTVETVSNPKGHDTACFGIDKLIFSVPK